MPELPEVETIRRHLLSVLPSKTVIGVDLRLPKLIKPSPGLRHDDLVLRTVLDVKRHAKQLVIDFSDGLSLLIHLKMTGQLVYERVNGQRLCGGHPIPAFDSPLPHKSTHLIVTFNGGDRLFLTDIRQFGVVRLLATDDVPALVQAERYGPDALDPALTPARLAACLMAHPSASLKPTLLDQTVIAGLGNIYADEALFQAHLHPRRTPASLQDGDMRRLHAGILDALAQGLAQGGFSIVNGRARPLNGYPRVHGRAGAPCPTCGARIEKTVVGGRATYVCTTCQRPPHPTKPMAER